MSIVLSILFIGIVHTFLSIVIPGIYIKNKVYSFFMKNNSVRAIDVEYIILVIATGILFNFIEFLIVTNLNRFGIITQVNFMYIKYGVDLFLLISIIWSVRHAFFNFPKYFCVTKDMAINLGLILLAILIGIIGISNYPHTLDCGQLLWTKQIIENVTNVVSGYGAIKYSSGNGAIGYSALIYFPGLLFDKIPLVTLAAGFKILVSMLVALTVIYAINVLNFTYKNITKLTYFVIIIFSFFGQYGVIEVGKDSIFAVIFSLLYIISLAYNKNERDYIKSAIFFACATCLGSITVPYLFLITFIYLIISFGQIRTFLFIFWLICFSFIGLLIQFNCMLGISILYLAILAIILASICFLLRNIGYTKLIVESKSISLIKASGFSIFIILVIIIANSLMPVKVAIIPWFDTLGNPFIEYRAPLDGIMTLPAYIFTFEPILAKLIIGIGIIGLIIYPIYSRLKPNLSIVSLALFPFTMLLSVLIFSHIKSPFNGFNLWDMFRDVINWYGGVIFGLFLLLLIDSITLHFRNKTWAKFTFCICCFILIGISIVKNHNVIKNWRTGAYYTSIGGDKNAYIAELAEYITLNKNPLARGLYISKNSSAYFWFYSFQMYSNLPLQNIDFTRASDIASIKSNSPIAFIGRSTDILQLVTHGSSNGYSDHLDIKELHHFSNQDEALYLISYVDKPNNSHLDKFKFIPAQIEIGSGFYDNEQNGNGVNFRWVQQYSDLSLYTPKLGHYTVTMHVIHNTNTNKTLSIYLNDKLIKQYNLRQADYNKIIDISFVVDTREVINKVKLVSNLPGSKFPNDAREICYGIIMPVEVSAN